MENIRQSLFEEAKSELQETRSKLSAEIKKKWFDLADEYYQPLFDVWVLEQLNLKKIKLDMKRQIKNGFSKELNYVITGNDLIKETRKMYGIYHWGIPLFAKKKTKHLVELEKSNGHVFIVANYMERLVSNSKPLQLLFEELRNREQSFHVTIEPSVIDSFGFDYGIKYVGRFTLTISDCD